MKKEQVDEMIKEAKEEIAKEDYDSCKAGLKRLMERLDSRTRDLERFKARISNDPKGAADEFRGDNPQTFRVG